MANNTMEKMKQLIEAKKQASSKQGYKKVAEEKQMNGNRKAIRNKKTGGVFDK